MGEEAEQNIHMNIYSRLNTMSERVATLSGKVEAQTNTVSLLVDSIQRKDEMLMKILKWVGILGFFLVASLLVMATYGAFGKGGTDALKDATKNLMPVSAAMPGADDIGRFFKHGGVA